MHHSIILVLSKPFEAEKATSEWPQISKNYLDIIQTQLKTKSWGLRDVVPIPCVPEYVCVHVVWQDVHFYTLLPLSFVRIWDGGDGAEISSLQQHFLPPLNNWNHPQFWARLQLWKLWTADLSPSSLQHCSTAVCTMKQIAKFIFADEQHFECSGNQPHVHCTKYLTKNPRREYFTILFTVSIKWCQVKMHVNNTFNHFLCYFFAGS